MRELMSAAQVADKVASPNNSDAAQTILHDRAETLRWAAKKWLAENADKKLAAIEAPAGWLLVLAEDIERPATPPAEGRP